ncbi:hypothetical protein CEG14_21840 [Bordetella genomosp. 1]|uniref:Uncharacterized protein n=1 Tax=Bordetella genomosp. 1 TaxID=1395607 RepID=A0A261RWG0_9BORD|nr:DUF1295 domain-containing protein [Bordetella genomosp. 1]OZI29265.1 hypothetical protein CEG14_21840 [Bordetella genomosp. 1]
MNAPLQLLALAVLMTGAMSLAWGWQRRHDNAGIVDAVWAAGVGGAALLIGASGTGAPATRAWLALLGGLWAARLAWHIWRRVRAEPEDGRYRALRAHWQGDQGKFYLFFLFQAGLVVLFALPFTAVAANPHAPGALQLALALAIWLAAVGGEGLADRQLAAWRADPANRGRTCRAGLWRYSRHPNYFFEWCHWFAYVALAWGSPLFWLSLSGPVLMYVFLRWISGIPFTEKQALRTRGEDYRAYQRDTPMFFPWFPRKP